MLIWQVNANQYDSNHMYFVVAESTNTHGRTKKSKSIVTWDWAKSKPNMFYFYLEIIK